MNRFIILLVGAAVALLVCACAGTTYNQGVPNLLQVRADVLRSGQPTSAKQWQTLKDLGVRTVVKLNFPSEASDDGARAIGLDVHELGIQPDANLFDTFVKPDAVRVAEAVALFRSDTFVKPDAVRVAEAVALACAGNGVLIHCTHGQDRTGLIVGIERVQCEGWTKHQAWQEMLANGFHWDLIGLVTFWVDFQPTNQGNK